MEKKWFSFNEKTQRTELIKASPEAFSDTQLLYWSRGMEEWVKGPQALELYLNPPAIKIIVPEIQNKPLEQEKTKEETTQETISQEEKTKRLKSLQEEQEVIETLNRLSPKLSLNKKDKKKTKEVKKQNKKKALKVKKKKASQKRSLPKKKTKKRRR